MFMFMCMCAPAVAAGPMDAGAMCMPGAVDKVQRLIDDAVSKGAQVRCTHIHRAAGAAAVLRGPVLGREAHLTVLGRSPKQA